MATLKRAFAKGYLSNAAKKFIFTPKAPLPTDIYGKRPVYCTDRYPFKFRYLLKFYFANAFISSIAVPIGLPAIVGSVFTTLYSMGMLQSSFGCKVVQSVRLHECGKKVEVNYRMMRFIQRSADFDIEQLRHRKQGFMMRAWSLKRAPQEVVETLNQNKELKFPFYVPVSRWSFLLFNDPKDYHKESLLNIFNGIPIDTTRTQDNSGEYYANYTEELQPTSDSAGASSEIKSA
mmetsp:Transcript_9628/g.18767  ORF Transcript_9628/g.18767 Transcript_9628/m.18767 type:complete len:233 (+) Transcript_9628:1556-2254(+)